MKRKVTALLLAMTLAFCTVSPLQAKAAPEETLPAVTSTAETPETVFDSSDSTFDSSSVEESTETTVSSETETPPETKSPEETSTAITEESSSASHSTESSSEENISSESEPIAESQVNTDQIVIDAAGGTYTGQETAFLNNTGNMQFELQIPVKPGYTFAGWLVTGPASVDGNTLTVTNQGTVLLTAQWTAAAPMMLAAPRAITIDDSYSLIADLTDGASKTVTLKAGNDYYIELAGGEGGGDTYGGGKGGYQIIHIYVDQDVTVTLYGGGGGGWVSGGGPDGQQGPSSGGGGGSSSIWLSDNSLFAAAGGGGGGGNSCTGQPGTGGGDTPGAMATHNGMNGQVYFTANNIYDFIHANESPLFIAYNPTPDGGGGGGGFPAGVNDYLSYSGWQADGTWGATVEPTLLDHGGTGGQGYTARTAGGITVLEVITQDGVIGHDEAVIDGADGYARLYGLAYPLTIDANGGTYQDAEVSVFSDVTGATLAIGTPTRTGYIFTGWTLSGAGNFDGSTYTYGAGEATLTAGWEVINYKITYNMQGGADPGNPAAYTVDTPSFTLKYPTRSGYVFTGWTTPEITLPLIDYTIPQGTTGDLTFTANWEPMGDILLKALANAAYHEYTLTDSTGATQTYARMGVDLDWSSTYSTTDNYFFLYYQKAGDPGFAQYNTTIFNRYRLSTSGGSALDQTFVDDAAPDPVTAGSYTIADGDLTKVNVTWNTPADNGVTYNFYVTEEDEYQHAELFQQALMQVGYTYEQAIAYPTLLSVLQDTNAIRAIRGSSGAKNILKTYYFNELNSYITTNYSDEFNRLNYEIGCRVYLIRNGVVFTEIMGQGSYSYGYGHSIGGTAVEGADGWNVDHDVSRFTVSDNELILPDYDWNAAVYKWNGAVNLSQYTGGTMTATGHYYHNGNICGSTATMLGFTSEAGNLMYMQDSHVENTWNGRYDSRNLWAGEGRFCTPLQQLGYLNLVSASAANGATTVTAAINTGASAAYFALGNSVSNSRIRDLYLTPAGYRGISTLSVPVAQSNTASVTLTSGLTGYYYVADSSPATAVSNSNGIFTATAGATVAKSNAYIHIAPVDKAGNIGATYHLRLAYLTLETDVDLTLAQMRGGVDGDWDYSYPGAAYRLYRSPAGAGTWTMIADTGVDMLYSDDGANDLAAPDPVASPAVTQESRYTKEITVSWAEPVDHGTTYDFQVRAYLPDAPDTDIDISNVTQETVTTGIRGYYCVIDDAPGTVFSVADLAAGTVQGYSTATTSLTVGLNEIAGKWLHILAVDRAGNESTVTHMYFDTQARLGALDLTVQDTETLKGLEGAAYQLTAAETITHPDDPAVILHNAGDVIAEVTSGADGTALVDGLWPGAYTLTQTMPRTGYVADSSPHSITCVGGPATLILSCERQTGRLTLMLADGQTTRPLSGGVYNIYAADDIVHPDGKTGTVYRAGQLVQTISTNRQGTAGVADLYLGSYRVQQITAPTRWQYMYTTGYQLDADSYTVSYLYDDPAQAEIARQLNLTNIPQRVEISIQLTDQDTGNPLAGAGYGVYAAANIIHPDGSGLLYAKDALVTTLTTDVDGEAAAAGLYNGAYYIKQAVSPETDHGSYVAGYLPDTASYDVSGSYTIGQAVLSRQQDLTAVRQSAELTIRLTAEGTETPLPGAVYGLYAAEDIQHPDGKTGVIYAKDALVATLTTDADGEAAAAGLYHGTYYLKEVTAPTVETADDKMVYGLDTTAYPITFTLDTAKTVLQKHLDLTNDLERVQGTIHVEKVWDDAGDQDGSRPASIDVVLTGSNGSRQTATLTAKDGWEYDFEDVTLSLGGHAVTYSVQEVAVNGYSSKVTVSDDGQSFTITNEHTPATRDLALTKVWDDKGDQDGLRPDSVTVTVSGSDGSSRDVTLTAEDGWMYLLTDLPVYYDHGTEVVYTAQETAVNGYTGTVTASDAGFTITNTHTPTTHSLSVSFTWDDNGDQDGLRPETVDITLDGSDGGEYPATLKAADGWTTNFTNLPNHYDGGKEVIYTVSENAPEGYQTETALEDSTIRIDHIHVPATQTVTVDMVWDDNGDQDGLRPETVDITLDGSDGGEYPATLKAADGWTTAFTDLPVYYNHGVRIEYTLDVTAVPAYADEITADGTDIAVTRTHIPDTKSVSLAVVWDDDDNRDGLRPEKVTPYLEGSDGQEYPVALTPDAGWSHTETGLPAYHDGGSETVYTLEAPDVPGYDRTITETDGEYEVTYQHEPARQDIQVGIVWDDEDNRDGLRPATVAPTLTGSDGTETALELTADNKFTAEIKGLYVYADGNQIAYMVEAPSVEGYSVSVAQDGTQYTLTYRHVHVDPPAQEPAQPAPPAAPADTQGSGGGDTGDSYVAMLGVLLLLGGLTGAVILYKKRKVA